MVDHDRSNNGVRMEPFMHDSAATDGVAGRIIDCRNLSPGGRPLTPPAARPSAQMP